LSEERQLNGYRVRFRVVEEYDVAAAPPTSQVDSGRQRMAATDHDDVCLTVHGAVRETMSVANAKAAVVRGGTRSRLWWVSA
jgi:hypothetical protein